MPSDHRSCPSTKIKEDTPPCNEEVTHWTQVVQSNPKDPELLEKAQFKLRCYLNWCLGQKDVENTRIQFKACCKSSQQKIEERLNREKYGQDQFPTIVARAEQYVKIYSPQQQ